MAFTALRKPQIRVQVQKSRAYGNEPAHGHDHHDHHHHVSYQHLHRPAITPDTFQLFSKSEEQIPELKKETLMQNHGHLVAKGARPEVCWSQQIFQSPAVLNCISELFGTEFWFDKHDSATLLPAYQVQLRCFEEIKVPELQAEGISQVTIDLLHEIYIARAHLCESEIDNQFGTSTWADRLNIFKKKSLPFDRNFGMRHMSDGSMWFEEPYVESRMRERAVSSGRPGLFYKPFSFQESFQPHNQVNDGKGFKNNQEWAEHNIKTFKQIQALVTAIDRGLTDDEKDRMIAKLKNFKSQITVDPAFDARMTAALKDIVDARKNGDSTLKQKVRAYYDEFCDTTRNGTNAIHARQTFDLAMQESAPKQPSSATSDEANDGLYLREGIDYFNGEGQRQAVLNELMSWFKFKVAKAHVDVMNNPSSSAETKSLSQRLKAATDYFVSPSIQKDLELMKLLRTSNLSFKQKEEFLNIFSDGTQSNIPDHVIRNVLHPHKVTVSLLGNKLKMLLKSERVEYTQFFTDGSDSMFYKDHEALPPKAQLVNDEMHSEDRLVSPVIDRTSDFPTAQAHLHHIKLNKLFFDYYGIDRTSEEGMAIIDQIVHTYDISPGESTLERAQAIPMPEHTFDELPLLKYDGYEYSDVEPEPDRTVENFDVSQIEHTMNLFLDELNKATKGKEPITLSKFKENNRLSTYQYSVLRSVLNLETSEPRRIALMRKIWGTVLPESELQRLFHDQEAKFHENHH